MVAELGRGSMSVLGCRPVRLGDRIGRRADTRVVGHLWPSPPTLAISLVMLMVDSVELLQVRPYHLDLALDEPREFLLCRQDNLLMFG